MTIHFPKPTGGFTALPNSLLEDGRISLQARMLLALVLANSYRSDDTTLAALADLTGVSTSTAHRLVQELIAHGYARRAGHRIDFTSVPDTYTAVAPTVAPKPKPAAEGDALSRIVTAWKTAAAGKTAQRASEIRRLAAQALTNGASEQAVTEAITTIARAGEPVKDFRITLALSGRYRPAADKSIHYAADRKRHPDEYCEDLTPTISLVSLEDKLAMYPEDL